MAHRDSLALGSSILRRIAFEHIPMPGEGGGGQGVWTSGYAPKPQRDDVLVESTGWEIKPSNYRVHSTMYGDLSITQRLHYQTPARNFPSKPRSPEFLAELEQILKLMPSMSEVERNAYRDMLEADCPDLVFDFERGTVSVPEDALSIQSRRMSLLNALAREERDEQVGISAKSKRGEKIEISSRRDEEHRMIVVERELRADDGQTSRLRIVATEQKIDASVDGANITLEKASELARKNAFDPKLDAPGGKAIAALLELSRASAARHSLAAIYLALKGEAPPPATQTAPANPIVTESAGERAAEVARTTQADALFWHLDTLHTGDYQITGSDFARWVRGEIDELPKQPTTNCWQAALVLAHRAGAISKDQIVAMHENAAKAAQRAAAALGLGDDRDALTKKYQAAEKAYLGELMNALNWHQRSPLKEREPKPGDLIFLSGPPIAGNPHEVRHVGMYLRKTNNGQHAVVALFGRGLERTTAEKLMRGDFRGTQAFSAPAPWSEAR